MQPNLPVEHDRDEEEFEDLYAQKQKELLNLVLAKTTKQGQAKIEKLEVKLDDLSQWWDGQKELIDKYSNLRTVIDDRFTKRAEEHGDLKSDTKDYLSCIVKPDVAKLEIHQKNDLEAISTELDAVKRTM